MMAADERATVAALDACRAVFRRHIETNQGRVVDTAGDSVLALFDTAAGAVHAALAIQRELPGDLLFRIGVHLGDVLEKADGSAYGDGVNIAARLQTLAAPGEVAISDVVKIAVRGRVDAAFVDRGEHSVKNIPGPVHWYCAAAPEPRGGATEPRTRTLQQLVTLPSIAILPFRCAGDDPDAVIFADGLRADMQQALAKIAGLMVLGFATTNSYRNKELPPGQKAEEMGVVHLLEGFVQRAGQRARISMSLIHGPSGRVLWSNQYDRVLDDSFEVQDEITERVVTALDVKLLSGEQARVWRKTLKHPRAREHYYRAMYEFMKGQKDANALARENFEQVAALAPGASIGPTHVAFTHWMDAFRGWTPEPARSFDTAAQWAQRALAMEDADGQAHTMMGHIHLYKREHDKAIDMVEKAVTIRPSCTNANAHLANIYYYCGRPADAADRIRQAMRLTPVHPPWFKIVLATSCKEVGLWAEAARAAADVLRMKPDDVDARLVLIESSLAGGDAPAARRFAEEVRKLHPDFSVQKWAERQPYREAAVLERIVTRLREAGLT